LASELGVLCSRLAQGAAPSGGFRLPRLAGWTSSNRSSRRRASDCTAGGGVPAARDTAQSFTKCAARATPPPALIAANPKPARQVSGRSRPPSARPWHGSRCIMSTVLRARLPSPDPSTFRNRSVSGGASSDALNASQAGTVLGRARKVSAILSIVDDFTPQMRPALTPPSTAWIAIMVWDMGPPARPILDCPSILLGRHHPRPSGNVR